MTTAKGEQTRARILDTALDLLRERGYEKTTMRDIARSSGVSLGSAYYYFKSKEHLVQAFYARTHTEHLRVCEPLLAGSEVFEQRLRDVLHTKIETSMPYHRSAAALFRAAADPESPLNPFSEASGSLRAESTALFEKVLTGSRLRTTGTLRERLPSLLWTFQMGVILYWIHDRSEGCSRTHTFIDRAVDLVGRLVRLANLPPFRPVLRSALALLDDLAPAPVVAPGVAMAPDASEERETLVAPGNNRQ